jgi:hypothetical protein
MGTQRFGPGMYRENTVGEHPRGGLDKQSCAGGALQTVPRRLTGLEYADADESGTHSQSDATPKCLVLNACVVMETRRLRGYP